MKRFAMVLIILLTATSLLAGGKNCDAKKHAAKSVELTGTLVRSGSGEGARTIFRVANGDRSYTVCEQTKASVLGLTSDRNATYRVKGTIVSCGEGEELLIESAKKV